MTVHDVARRGFDAGAIAYDRARPSYPPDALDWLVEHLRLHAGTRCCDLAAGTGKMTSLLVPSGAELLAVEPVAGMAAMLRRRLPDVPLVSAVAEGLPFAPGSLDAVVVAQAFHWFDADRAFAELARVVRPGGRVALIWNTRDRSVDWVDALWSIIDRVEERAPWRDHDRWRDMALGDRKGFGPLHAATFFHEQVLDREGIVERFESVSHVATLEPENRDAVLGEVRTVLDTHPATRDRAELAIPYRVDACWRERE